jgi:hypothetical protein
LIHPVNAALLLALAGGVLETLQLLDLALFFTLAPELVDPFALIEGFLFFGPDALLVA